ncbi:MAG: polyphosphate kinase 1 [Oxalobacter formigenes]|nr:polyphosphate kinase 1 [Oxalobacter formigenes]
MKAASQLSTVNADSGLYLDRDISLLAFNARVLAQAENTTLPLMERLRYLCIAGSNLDEFFEVRVASLHARRYSNANKTASEIDALLQDISKTCHALVEKQYQILNREVLPLLAENGIHLLGKKERNEAQQAWVASFFNEHIRPLLTPIVLDPAHPFPRVVNKGLHFIISLSGKDAFGRGSDIAILKAPRILPRVIRLPEALSENSLSFSLLSSIIQANIASLFPQRKILAYSQFRITRDSDLWVDEEEVKNLREALQSSLHSRHYGNAVRLEVARDCPVRLSDFLLHQFNLEQKDLYYAQGPVNIVRLNELFDHVKKPELYFPSYTPSVLQGHYAGHSLFDALKKQDILLHHPFQSFQTVIDFIRTAATDPAVVVIKQTIYRAGMTSELMESLISAALQGKEVIAVVELKARFDEKQNIDWAKRLEEAGAQVVYGVMGLKTHAKLALAIRREGEQLCCYAHLGTGNYNPNTTRSYTDFGLITADREIGREVNEIFIQLTSLAKPAKLERLWLAPFDLHKNLIRAIANEARLARLGKKGRIIAKMNALIDESVIRALYAASSAGVKIDLIVRGACALRPGVPGLSENIRVRSIIGRFLEHTRIYYFRNDLKHDLYLSSADWMARNLFRRVEVAFPVMDKALKKRVMEEGLLSYLKDNQNAWELRPDGIYRQKKPRKKLEKYSAQQHLMQLYGASPTQG